MRNFPDLSGLREFPFEKLSLYFCNTCSSSALPSVWIAYRKRDNITRQYIVPNTNTKFATDKQRNKGRDGVKRQKEGGYALRAFTKRLRGETGTQFPPPIFHSLSINSGHPIIEKLCWRFERQIPQKTKGTLSLRSYRKISSCISRIRFNGSSPLPFPAVDKILENPGWKVELERWEGEMGWGVGFGEKSARYKKKKEGDTVTRSSVNTSFLPPPSPPPFFCSSTRLLSTHDRRISPSSIPRFSISSNASPPPPRYRNRSPGGAWRYVVAKEKSSFRNKPFWKFFFQRQKFSCPPLAAGK